MPHVLVAGKIHPSGVAKLLSTAGFTVDNITDTAPEAFLPYLPKADAVLIRTQAMSSSAIANAPNLKIVSRHGVGYDAVDVTALNVRGIPLAIVGDINSRTVAEHTFALMLGLTKQLVRADQAVRGGDWGYRDAFEATELAGKYLLIVGFGRVGRRVARLADAFDMRVFVYDAFIDAKEVAGCGAEPITNFHDGLAGADIVTLHLPKTGDKPLIGASELAVMKPGAVLINTARGGLVDEAALATALGSGDIGGAALDVFEDEPPQEECPVLPVQNMLLTPHMAGLTAECAARMAAKSAQNIIDFFDGNLDPELVVNANAITL